MHPILYLHTGNRLVKEVYDELNLELPMREESCDRWQIHRNKYTIHASPQVAPRSAPSSPTQTRAHPFRSMTPPPTMPPPQRKFLYVRDRMSLSCHFMKVDM